MSLPKQNIFNSLFHRTGTKVLHLAILAFTTLALYGTVSYAGYGSFSPIDYYDKTSGYYYRSVPSKQKKGGFLSSKTGSRHISNVFLYDPATQKSQLLFPKQDESRHINFVVHERKYFPVVTMNNEKKFFEFHRYGSFRVLNNHDLEQRPLRDHMLIGVYLPKSKRTELWHCKKDGTGLKKLITPPPGSSWHIDLKANKIRVFVPDAKKGYSVTSYDW